MPADQEWLLLLTSLAWLACGTWAAVIAARKNYWPTWWMIMGAVFGPSATVLAHFLPKRQKGEFDE